MSLHMSKCHIVGDHMSWLIYFVGEDSIEQGNIYSPSRIENKISC